jgi:hypothetical protein
VGVAVADTALLLDTEFLTAEGAPRRFWCGPFDPDPVVVQIGGVRLSLTGQVALAGEFHCLVRPLDRLGRPVALDPLMTRLTGLTDARLAADGLTLPDALAALQGFAGDAPVWSWGKDELNLMAISCYVAGIAPPIPAARFGNLCGLMLKAGVPLEEVQTTRSHTLCAALGVQPPPGQAHDALHDARCLAAAVLHLTGADRLTADDLRCPMG